jgi:hypothetical protein
MTSRRDPDRDTLDRRRRVPGEDHPDTLGSMGNLAPGVIRALAQAIVTWFNGPTVEDRLELVAPGAGGSGRYRADSAPSIEGVVGFLREGVG